jgi:hypothetical protein
METDFGSPLCGGLVEGKRELAEGRGPLVGIKEMQSPSPY